MQKLIPKSWSDFQHYKDRSPTWIKLHKSLLDDYDFQMLQVASRALAPMLWLLASDSKNQKTGEIEFFPQKIAFRLRMTEHDFLDALNPLIEKGFFELVQDASELLADVYHKSSPEKRREEERREESNQKNLNSIKPINQKNENLIPEKTIKPKTKATYSKDLFTEYQIDGQLLDDFITLRKEKKLPITATAINGLKREGEKVGLSLPEVIKICCERGWGGFNSNWKIDLPKLVTGGGFQDAI